MIKETIDFKNYEIVKGTLEEIDNSFYSSLYSNIKQSVNINHFRRLSHAPGIQMGFSGHSSFSPLIQKLSEELKSFFKISNEVHWFVEYWLFVNEPKTKSSAFHFHKRLNPDSIEANWMTPFKTFVYYIQTPNKCNGNEGDLAFTTNEGAIYYHETLKLPEDVLFVKPQPGDFYIFPADLYHMPMLSPSSNLDRITLAGNFCCT